MPPTLSTTTKVDHLCLNSLSTLEPAKSWKSFLKGDKTVKKMNYCFTVLKWIWRAGGRPVFLINTVLIFCLAQTKVISPPKTHIREDKHQLFLQGAQWVHTLKPSDGQAESLPRAGRDIPRDSGGSLPTTRPPLSCLQALPARHVTSHHITSIWHFSVPMLGVQRCEGRKIPNEFCKETTGTASEGGYDL